MRIAVIGTGGQARVHAERMRRMRSPTLACIAGRSRESAAPLASALETEARTIAACLQDPAIDGVIVAVPTAAHREVTVAALEAGKHVLCESPFATTLADADAMIDAARLANRRLLVGYVSPFDPEAADIRARIATGDLGDIRLITTQRLFGRDHERETHYGDAVGELLTYDIQCFLWMLGGLTFKSAEGLMSSGQCMHVSATFEAAGIPLSCTAGQLMPRSFPLTFEMKVMGARAGLSWRLVLPTDGAPVVEYTRYGADGAAEAVALKATDPFVRQIKHFAAVIRGEDEDNRISAALARKTVAMTADVARAVRP